MSRVALTLAVITRGVLAITPGPTHREPHDLVIAGGRRSAR